MSGHHPWPPPMKRDRVRVTGPGTVIEHHRPKQAPSRALWFGIGFLAGTLTTLVLVALFGS
jgi:hypothetical protein